MGRSAEGEGLDQEAELLVDLLVGHADAAQDAALQLRGVDADGAAAHLEAVHDQVVGVGAALQRGVLDLVEVLVAHAGEGMVLGSVALLLLVVLEHGEVDDPAHVVGALGDELELPGHVQADGAEHLVDHGCAVCAEHHEVTGLHVEGGLHGLDLVVGEELEDGAGDGAVAAVGDPGHALGAELDGHLADLVDLRAGHVACALGVDGLDHAAAGQRGGEDLEVAVGDDLAQVDELHAKAAVRAVDAVAVHSICILDAVEREAHVGDAGLCQDLGHDVFHHLHDVVFGDVGHLDVDLGELGLAVCAQVLVAEAAGDLVVALHAAHHQQLLEELRGLGQRVEGAGGQARGHDEVACALGGGLAQDGGLDLGEAALVQGGAQGPGDGVAQAQGTGDLGAADVQVAPLHAGELIGLDAVFQGEGRGEGLVEDGAAGDDDLDLAGGQVGVGGVVWAQAHVAGDPDGPLGAHLLAQGEHICGVVRVEDALGDAGAVPQVHEDEAAVVTALGDPAAQGDGCVHVCRGELPAGVGMHGVLVQKISRHCMPSSNLGPDHRQWPALPTKHISEHNTAVGRDCARQPAQTAWMRADSRG